MDSKYLKKMFLFINKFRIADNLAIDNSKMFGSISDDHYRTFVRLSTAMIYRAGWNVICSLFESEILNEHNFRKEAERMQNDRRVHKRFPLKLSIFCQRVGFSGSKLIPGRTVNVSPGGILVEMKGGNLKDGDLLSVEMSVPPTEGLLDFGGSFSSYARVVRLDGHQDGIESSEKKIALEFCDSPKLRI